MCARFTVLSDTPIAAAIAGCVIPLSRNNTIWMRWRCAAGIFHRSAVFSRRTSALLHLTIWSSESDGASESRLGQEKQPAVPAAYLVKDPRFKPLWRWYQIVPDERLRQRHDGVDFPLEAGEARQGRRTVDGEDVVANSRHGLDDGQHLPGQWDAMRPVIFHPAWRQRPQVAGDLVPAHASDFAAPLAGQQQHLDARSHRPADGVACEPQRLDFGV